MEHSRINLKTKKRIVIKIGSSSLTHETGRLNLRKIDDLARILTDFKNQGKEIILVSSGAIAVGIERLQLKDRPKTIEMKQAAAAVGQGALMQIYEKFFGEYNQQVAQILLTKDVVDHPIRKRNTENTFCALLSMGVIPIVNENDTVATEEIEFGDNDTLSAMVAEVIKADLLILLSDIDGFYTADPRLDSTAQLISVIERITPEIERAAGGVGSNIGTGGMATKISAAQIACGAGIDMVIANAAHLEDLYKILEGEAIGSLFLGQNIGIASEH
ncbi:MAG: glutamate 5-kinase [Epulopiscium sp.]|nr:glutamate 5-kinase [Candidatus Epulonipiscium sp.]